MSDRRHEPLFRPPAADEVSEEFAFHVEMRVRELMQQGLPEAEARARAARDAAALRAAEGECVQLAHERERSERRTRYLADLVTDVRFALRGLARAPGFAVVALLTVALGVGANAGIFSVLNGVVLRPLPYAEPERLVRVTTQFPSIGFERFWLSPPEYFELQEQVTSFESVGAWRTESASVGGDDAPVRVTSSIATPELFDVLGVAPARGRTFLPDEAVPGAPPVALLSHTLWQTAFGASGDIVGRTILVNGTPREVVGVMPPGFDILDAGVLLWTPAILDRANRQNRGSHYLDVVARLRPGVIVEEARGELRVFASREPTHGHVHAFSVEQHPLAVAGLQDDLVRDTRKALLLLLGAVGFVLLIACANVANLLLVRAETRQRELAVRSALGGGRGRLTRQLVTEGLVLSLLGGALGLFIGHAGVRALLTIHADGVPRAAEIGLDATVLLFTLGVSLLTGVLFGLAPLLQLAARDTAGVLREAGARATAGGARLHVRRALVLTEIALAVVLLIGCGLLLRSFAALQRVDPGFDARGLVTFEISLPAATYPGGETQNVFYARLFERLGALPGVSGVAAMSGLPPQRAVDASDTDFEGLEQTATGPAHYLDYFQMATPAYLETMRIPVRAGRGFEPADAHGPPVVLINERTARVFYGDTDPIGRRLRPCCDDAFPWFTIVGVVGDVKQGGLHEDAGTEAYFLHDQAAALDAAARTMNVVVRTGGDTRGVLAAVRRVVRELDATLPVAHLRTMDDVLHASTAGPRFMTLLLSVFAGVALVLAAIGTYGVMMWTVTQRRREIGIRMAMGAERSAVLGMVMRQGFGVALVGLAVGIAGALALTRLMSSLLFGVSATDAAAFIVAPAVLAVVAALACYVPALRATRVDPATVLKQE
jgi:putative ABC transport system permease protein